MDKQPMKIWVEDGQIFCQTPEDEVPVTPKVLLEKIQEYLFIDFRTHPSRIIRSREHKGDVCPYCNSTDTIGHGSRTTQKELQIRRWCNSCNRTFIAGKEPTTEITERQKKDSKGSILLLHVLGFNEQEIADRLNIPWSVASSGIKEHETEILETYCLANEISKQELEAQFKMGLAPEFQLSNLIKDNLRYTTVWDYDGRIAIQNKRISNNILFLLKKDVKIALFMNKTNTERCLRNIAVPDRDVIMNYLEDKKDDMAGILPKTHIFTKVAEDAGELNADLMESAAHKDEDERSGEDQ